MSEHYYVDADQFGRTMEQLLNGIVDDVTEVTQPAVKKAAQLGRREVRKGSPERDHEEKHYKEGWSFKVKKGPEGWSAEIGNKTKPGLAHLLEKGHAKVGGGRVDPSPAGGHIGPASEKTFEEFIRLVEEGVDSL